MSATVKPFKPNWCIRPGVTLREWLAAEHKTQAWLGEQIGVSQKHVSQIVNGKATYSAALAVKIGAATGISPEFWFRLQADWLIGRALGRKDVSDD